MQAPSLAAVEKALYDDRSVVRHHGMRRTLWVATPEVVRLFHAAATRKLLGPEHRRTAKLLAESGVADPDAWLADARDQVLAALHEHGPMTARQLGEPGPGAAAAAGAGRRERSTRRPRPRTPGCCCSSASRARSSAPGRPAPGSTGLHLRRDGLLAARRARRPAGARGRGRDSPTAGCAGSGPATTADLQWWTGWTATLTRHALADCDAVPVDLEPAEGEGTVPGWLAAGDEAPVGRRGRVGRAAARAGPDHDGLEAAGVVPPGRRRRPVRRATATRGRRSGRTAGSSARGRRRPTARSARATSSTYRRAPDGRSTRRSRRLRRWWATPGSRSAFPGVAHTALLA